MMSKDCAGCTKTIIVGDSTKKVKKYCSKTCYMNRCKVPVKKEIPCKLEDKVRINKHKVFTRLFMYFFKKR